MNENWSRPEGAELDENEAALRRMRVIVWMFGALIVGVLCLGGLIICARFAGGG